MVWVYPSCLIWCEEQEAEYHNPKFDSGQIPYNVVTDEVAILCVTWTGDCT